MNAVAVIGMSCRFPGASTPAQFWRNLRGGVESIAVLSDEEQLAAGVPPELLHHPHYVKAAAVLDDIERFDAAFFGLSPREAEVLDVQHRIFLECAWEALEDASCDPHRHAGSIGVYAGAGMNAYLLSNLIPQREVLASVGGFQALISNDKDYLPTRVSYKLNLRGPSVSVQTACSTSLVAVHLACQALLAGECDVALAGGVSVRVPQRAGYLYEEGMILSPDGHCRAFDARAAGTVPGSGAGVVVLKRLEDALADGDRIDAVVIGSAINNDGALKVGYTAPSVDGQRGVIKEAMAVAGVTADSIAFVEAHGTGTPLGDPIEVAALQQAYAASGAHPGSCVLGSVKTNVGHLDAAAGVAGFMKAVLALRHREIPPTLHFTAANPQIDLAAGPFRVSARLERWPAGAGPARAAVSSFGIGGTNAHVILEAAPVVPERPAAESWLPLVLSARSESALDAHAQAVARALAAEPSVDLADVAWSLQAGRHAFEHRLALVAADGAAASAALARGEGDRGRARTRSVVFMFPGQGSQEPGMAAPLYATAPTFRATLDQCCALLAAPLGVELRALLLATEVTPELTARMTQTAVAQPALFIVEYALALQLREWGVTPAAAIGHSVGEYTAACLGGTIALADALTLLAERGRLMQQLPAGRMMAVRTTAELLVTMAAPDVSVAAINAPGLCVASGPAPAIAALERRCAAKGIDCQDLQTSHAFHSAAMDAILSEFGEAVARVPLSPPSVPWISNVTGTWITSAEAVDPGYWVRHLRQPVLFSAGVDCALGMPQPLLLEVGPGRALTTLALLHPGAGGPIVVPSMRRPRDRGRGEEVLARALGRLWVAGVPVKWDALETGRARRRVSLPTYPFERQRYWVDPPERTGQLPEQTSATAGALKRPLDDWFYVPAWKSAPAPPPAAGGPRSTPWLVFARDDDSVVRAVTERLRRDGASVVVITAASAYLRDSDTSYRVRPGERDDYETLLADLRRRGIVPGSIVHAWCVDGDGGAAVATGDAAALDDGFFSLLWLARALGDGDAGDVRLHVLSSRVQPLGDGPVSPRRAALLGPVQVIPRELPSIWCRSIDYSRSSDAAEPRLVDLLYRELLSDAEEPLVAYRHNVRHTRTLERIVLTKPPGGAPLREGGHYLVTGGLGGAGLVLADHLARSVRARLTLVGRTPFPAREAWAQIATSHGADDPLAAKIRQLQAMEEAGGRVWTTAADVGDLDRLRDVVREAETRFGPVHGVIHAAGVAGGGVIQRRTRGDAEAVLRPKVDGALNLVRMFEGAALDWMVFMSSLTTILGETGQVDYCAAGAVLDALAHQRRAVGERVCCVDWDTWQEVGMAAAVRLPGALQALREESLRAGIRNTEAVEVLNRALASDLAQVVVSTREPAARLLHDAREAARLAAVVQPSDAGHVRPALAVPFAAPVSPQEQALCRMWQSLLGIASVGVDDDFFDLGGHSLLATQVLSRVRDQMGVRVSLGLFFEHPTIRGLAAEVEARQLDAILADIDRLTDDEAVRELSSADADDSREPL